MVCPNCGSENQNDAKNCLMCGSALGAPSSPHLPTGTRLAGDRYSIGRVLGQGGFGITYQGADMTMKRLVAIKELFPDGSTRNENSVTPPRALGKKGFADNKASFLKEVSVLARFNHEGIVRVYDTFEDNETAYLVMEFLQGETFSERISKWGTLNGEEVLEIAKKLCEALQVVHEAGLLHRDVKPDNIFFTEDERIVLIDFGSARQFVADKTSKHTQFITPGYAPLEQYASEAKFGPYTDVYALGATLYHALKGHAPPNANDRIMGRQLSPLPQGIPVTLSNAIEQALMIKVDSRPQSIEEFIKLLEQTQEIQEVQTPKEFSPQERLTLRAHRSHVSAVAFSPDGQIVVSGSNDRTLRVWEVASGNLLRTLAGPSDTIFAVSFILEGKEIATGSGDLDLLLWKVDNGRNYETLKGHSRGILALAYDVNNRILASGSGDKSVRLWKLPSNNLMYVLEGHRHAVRSLAFSPDGRILASGSDDFTIKLWDARRGRFTANILGHTDSVLALAFNPQGNILASGSEDSTIKLWEVSTNEVINTLEGHTSWIRTLAFSPDGRFLVSGSVDRTIKIWEAATGEPLETLLGHSDWVKSVAFSPDGQLLASAGGDATVKLWDLYK